MAKVNRLNWVRELALTFPVFAVFVAAWVSDAVPTATVPSLALAFVSSLVSLGVAYKWGRNQNETRSLRAPEIKSLEAPAPDYLELSHAAAIKHYSRWIYSQSLLDEYQRVAELNQLVFAARQNSLRKLAALAEFRSRVLLTPSESFERSISPAAPLDAWKLVAHGDRSFNIVAGTFEIEYFHGQVNIRILDPTKVTVEGSDRGAPVISVPPLVKAPIYN